MVNILLFGATGFVGNAVAFSLRRAGHIVHALARDPSSSKVQDLEKNEIITHKGDVKDLKTWFDLAKDADVIIDAGDTHLGKEVFEGTLEAAKARPLGAPKQTYIYTSGHWVHGDSRKQTTDRSVLPGKVHPLICNAWRPEFEARVISAETRQCLEGIVIRSAVAFGGASTVYGGWFKPLVDAAQSLKEGKQLNGKIQVPAKKDAMIGNVHKDDLAEAYRLAVEKASIVATMSYPVFDITNPSESLYVIVHSAALALGLDPESVEFIHPENKIIEALCASFNTSSERARDILGWQARHPSLVSGMEVYMRAFVANGINKDPVQ